MDGTQDLDIGFQEVTVKNKRVKKGSKIFKKLLEILHSGKERHVIEFTDNEKTEFEIKFIDKKNKKQWHETDISLFLALDSISPKHREQENLAEKTKNRFKANMTKLVRSGYLKYLGSRAVSKAVTYKKYRILKDCPIWDESVEGYFLESTDTESKESSEDISSSLGSPLNSSCNFLSHYSCLSGKSSENEYKNMLYGTEESINIAVVANQEVIGSKEGHIGEEISVNLLIVNPNVGELKWNNGYMNIPYAHEESINIAAVSSEEIVGAKEEHIGGAGEVLQNLLVVNPNVGKLKWNNGYMNIPYAHEESINIAAVSSEEIVGAKEEHIGGAGEVLQNLLVVNPNVGKLKWNNGYMNIPYAHEESINIAAVSSEEIVGAKEEHIGGAGEVLQNLLVVNPNVGKLKWNNGYMNIPYAHEESINIAAVSSEEIVGAKEEHIGGAGEVLQNLLVVNPNVGKLKWNNGYKNIPYGNEGSINIAAVSSEEMVGAKEEHIGGAEEVLQNLLVVNPNVGELKGNNGYMNIPYAHEESNNIAAVENEEVVEAKEEHIGGAEENEYKNIPYGNEENTRIAGVVNADVVESTSSEHIDGEVSLNLSVVNPNVDELNLNKRKLNLPDTQNKKYRELDWSPTKSYVDDTTMFGEVEDDDGILKDSENPLLSSAVVTDEMFGFTSDGLWEKDYKTFSFDETMYDSE